MSLVNAVHILPWRQLGADFSGGAWPRCQSKRACCGGERDNEDRMRVLFFFFGFFYQTPVNCVIA